MNLGAAAAPASQPSTTQRPIPLRMRPDLVARRIDYQGEGYWVLKDPLALRYHRLQGEQFSVLQLLNGVRHLEEIHAAVQREYPMRTLKLADIQRLVMDLHQRGLVISLRTGQGIALLKRDETTRWKKLRSAVGSILYLKLPGWDPQPLLDRLLPWVRGAFSTAGLTAGFVLILASWLLLGMQFGEIRARLPEFEQFFGWPNLMFLWVTLGGAKILHEFGHGLACRYYGAECHQMGALLLVFSPSLYCDASDSWLLKNKWQRIAIGAAGMYVEILIAAIALFAWWWTLPGLLNHLCLNLFFVTTASTVLFNANPLFRGDGYYMCSDWLEIPNLQQKAMRLLRETFGWYCLGIPATPDPFLPQTGRGWFLLYAVASGVYRWFMLFGILFFLASVLKPYGLQSLGFLAAGFAAFTSVWGLVTAVVGLIRAPRMVPLNYWKVTLTLAVFSGGIAAVLTLPLSLYVPATAHLEPLGVQQIYAAVPGVLTEIHVVPGDEVQTGDRLLVLQNPELDDEFRRLEREQVKLKAEIETFYALDEIAQASLAERKLQTTQERLAHVAERRQRLTILAPCSGRIIAPEARPEAEADPGQRQLYAWTGTPLDPENRGAAIAPQTHLLSIAPQPGFQAVVVVDQADRNDLRPGQKVELRFEHLPHRTYAGQVVEIAERHLEYAPRVLSSKYGGSLPTVSSGSEGGEKLTSIAYQAVIELPDDPQLMLTGLRGQARFLVARRTTADWLWRWLRQTFHFQL